MRGCPSNPRKGEYEIVSPDGTLLLVSSNGRRSGESTVPTSSNTVDSLSSPKDDTRAPPFEIASRLPPGSNLASPHPRSSSSHHPYNLANDNIPYYAIPQQDLQPRPSFQYNTMDEGTHLYHQDFVRPPFGDPRFQNPEGQLTRFTFPSTDEVARQALARR